MAPPSMLSKGQQLPDERRRLFSDLDLRKLIIPLVIEQMLTMMVGVADTAMVSYAGEAAVSGVSLVDMINGLYLFPAIEARMGERAYGSWDTVLEETVLRACVVRIMEQYDAEHAAQLLQEERDAGFTYIDSVYASLQTYLDNPDEYPTIVSFLPVVFEQLAAGHPA